MDNKPATECFKLATQFGESLDKDDFQQTIRLLSEDCVYRIGQESFVGPQAIVGSYEKNMIDGRAKLDKLVWGQSQIEPINESEYLVHFTDYLTHAGENFTHRCKQKLTFNHGKIVQIQHIDDPEEATKLAAFYSRVGIHQ